MIAVKVADPPPTRPCWACAAAEGQCNPAASDANCRECDAREIARSQLFATAIAADAITPDYRLALQRAFGEHWQNGHQRVRAWHRRMREAKA